MSKDILVPQINVNDKDVEILSWKVADGDYVQAGQIIVAVENSKGVTELSSEFEGYISLCCKEGEIMKVNEILAKILDTKETVSRNDVQITNDVKYNQEKFVNILEGVRFSNKALQYLEENKIEKHKFNQQGLVTKRALTAENKAPKKKSNDQNVAVKLSEVVTERVALSRSKAIEIDLLSWAQNDGVLTSSLTVYLNSSSIRKTVKNFAYLNDQLLPLIIYEFARLLKEMPLFNSYYTDGFANLYKDINIAIAMDLGFGLKAPVIIDANALDLKRISDEINELAYLCVENKIPSNRLVNSTVTVTDLSGDNIFNFMPKINSHQSMILGIGGDRNVAGEPLSLTCVFDHRLLTGRDVSIFLNELKNRLDSYGSDITDAQDVVNSNSDSNACFKCLISMQDYANEFKQDTYMLKVINGDGLTKHICHSCFMGY
ncbi:2-oxo acid dehydrogenase subunit E2 [Dolichospermum sp. ST_sed1]|nr:2-oxo acid dehydrogenase subunit E2 [Dolichospermum sp. ST_sed1]